MQKIISSTTADNDISRRSLLQGAAALGLSFLTPSLTTAAANQRGKERKKSLIVLWMAGGPSQLETWDPHPSHKIGGEISAITTKIPDLKIAHLFPQMAEQIHHLSVIRSMVSKEGDHERGTAYLKTGYRPEPTTVYPSLGAITVHQLSDPKVEIPQHVSLSNGKWPARGGYLGARLDAFKIYDPGRNIRNMKPRVDDSRQSRRLKNLEIVSQAFKQGRSPQTTKTLHQHMIERALTMMSSAQLKAFEIDEEPEALVEAYGDSRFGRGCLVARRLVETGVRAIEVTLNGFDTHTNNHAGHVTNAKILDPALATLIKDLKEKDLLDSTVILCIGEFGRTPKINPTGGRDHWASGFSCLLGGGGLASSVVIGETDPTGEKLKPTQPIQVNDLFATILKAVGVDYEKELISPIGRPLQLSDGTAIEQLFPADS